MTPNPLWPPISTSVSPASPPRLIRARRSPAPSSPISCTPAWSPPRSRPPSRAEVFVSPDLAIACALLHDTIEDTAVTREQVAAAFGEPVAAGVSALSKDPSLPKREAMKDSLQRIQAQPPEVWLVKLADRTVNLAPPPHYWSPEKIAAYREEAILIADTLAPASPVQTARLRRRIEQYPQTPC
ncbi:MAG: HD domain-containing protein [Polyangiaceae bacterium]